MGFFSAIIGSIITGLIGSIFSGGSSSSSAPMAPPPQRTPEPQIKSDVARATQARRRAAGIAGRDSTIRTSPLGLDTSNTTLLGG